MAFNVSEILCGAHIAYWGPSGSETKLGHTEDGSVLRIETEHAEIRTQEYGIAAVKRIHRGERVTVDVILKQMSNANLLIALLGSTTNASQWRFGTQAGKDLSSSTYAKRLRLCPITNSSPDSDESDSIIIHKAVPEPLPIEMKFVNEEASMIGVRFHALVDTSKSDGYLLGSWK